MVFTRLNTWDTIHTVLTETVNSGAWDRRVADCSMGLCTFPSMTGMLILIDYESMTSTRKEKSSVQARMEANENNRQYINKQFNRRGSEHWSSHSQT